MLPVRFALPEDIPRLVGLAEAEHARSPWRGLPFDASFVGARFKEFIESFGSVVFTTPGGYLGALLQPIGFSRAAIAVEYAFYAEDGRGMDLLRAFESWGENMGAKAIIVHDLAGEGRLARALERRRGYRPIGATVVKSINRQGAAWPS